MAWLESHQTLGAHPKTRKLAHLLGISRAATIGHLHYLWWWAMDYAQDGDLSRFEPLDIAIGAEWEGDADAFVEALVRAGFVDADDRVLIIHDWWEYGGKLIEKRRTDAERKRAARGQSPDDTRTAAVRGESIRRTSAVQKASVQETAQVENQPNQQNQTQPTGQNLPHAPNESAPGEGRYPPMFEEFWSRFPRKVAKDAALKAWKKRGVPPELHARMLEAIDRQRDSVDWTKDGGQFIPHPATWINGAGWLNELRPRASPVAGQPVTAQQQIEYLRVRIAEEEEREQNRNAEDRADAPYRLAANAG